MLKDTPNAISATAYGLRCDHARANPKSATRQHQHGERTNGLQSCSATAGATPAAKYPGIAMIAAAAAVTIARLIRAGTSATE
jgi:hypothetical protein